MTSRRLSALLVGVACLAALGLAAGCAPKESDTPAAPPAAGGAPPPASPGTAGAMASPAAPVAGGMSTPGAPPGPAGAPK